MHGRIQLPQMLREAQVRAESFNDSTNEIEVIFTTGARVRRRSFADGEFDEELVVTPGAVRLDRLNSGAPFLNSHWGVDLRDVLGSVVPNSARIRQGQGTARVQLSRRDDLAGIVQDIRDGVIRSVSVGYRVHAVEKRDGRNEVPIHRVIDWEPMELSAVPIPSDAGAQIRGERDRPAVVYTCRVITPPTTLARARMRMAARATGVGAHGVDA